MFIHHRPCVVQPWKQHLNYQRYLSIGWAHTKALKIFLHIVFTQVFKIFIVQNRKFIFLPKNMMWSISGRWADQSISKPSNTRSDRNITAMLLLQGERTCSTTLIINWHMNSNVTHTGRIQLIIILWTSSCIQVNLMCIVTCEPLKALYLWKPGVGWRLSGRKSERGAKYPPYAGMGRG